MPAVPLILKRALKPVIWGLKGQLPARRNERRDARVLRESGLFDVDYYLRTHSDVARSGIDPVTHYVRDGVREGRNPCPLFYTDYYLTNNPDVREAGVNPLAHFVTNGARENRKPNPLFDPGFYFERNPEVAERGQNPLRHFLESGAQQGCDPCPLFSSRWYLERYPDVAATGQNPLVHYLASQPVGDLGSAQARATDAEAQASTRLSLRQDEAVDEPASEPPKLLAFLLPQFHPIPENDEWWGPGFTEWTNVTRAEPLYPGQHQPRLPADLGFYDLRVAEVRERQAALARDHGLFGFCYYHYWFEGRRVLERPLQEVVESGKPDFPFCLCWANENWTRRWDGLDDEVLLRQEHSLASDYQFIQDTIPILKDPRYITVDGAPLLLIYRADKLRDPRLTASVWRDACRQAGLPGLHLCAVQFRIHDPREIGFDSAVEFPPHHFPAPDCSAERLGAGDEFTGTIRDYGIGAANALRAPAPDYVLYRGIVPSWDNTARRGANATIYHGATPQAYERWLGDLLELSRKRGGPSSRFVFVNAWNEWAEGAYLEPDQKHGRAYLEATRRAVERSERAAALAAAGKTGSHAHGRREPLVFVAHDAAAAGAQFVLLGLVEAISKRDEFEPHVVLQGGGALLPRFEALASTIVLDGSPEPGSVARRQLREAVSGLAKRGLRTVVCNTVVTAAAAEVCKEVGLGVVVIVHEQPSSIDQYFGGAETVDTIAEHADRVVTVSNFARDALAEHYGLRAEDLVVIRPPLRRLPRPRTSRDELRRSWLGDAQASDGPFLVLGCGTLYPRKGPDLFLELASRLRASRPEVDWRFVWAGGSIEADGVELHRQRAREAGLAEVLQFTGALEDISPLLCAADVFALTSREDPFPLVNLEAMSFGLPVVAFAGAGGAPELIEDDAGIVVPRLDVSAMARAVACLRDDSALRARLGDRAREKVAARYSAERYAERVLEVVREGLETPDWAAAS